MQRRDQDQAPAGRQGVMEGPQNLDVVDDVLSPIEAMAMSFDPDVNAVPSVKATDPAVLPELLAD